MIKVHKSPRRPRILTTKGIPARANNSRHYTRTLKETGTPPTEFEFDSKIFGHEDVKIALMRDQHNKCCYCESKIGASTYGDVEHYRPKVRTQQARSTPYIYPGYYWLAYDWSNLFLSCEVCNRSHKKSLFPLRDDTNRARSHTDKIRREEPLIVNPKDDPEKHISFRGAVAVGITIEGNTTIKATGLDRSELESVRRIYYKQAQCLYEYSKLGLSGSKEARLLIDEMSRRESMYSSMIRQALATGFCSPP